VRQGVRGEWKEISLTGEPRLLVGWRDPHHRLKAQRVKLHQDVFADLADLCRPTVSKIQDYAERPFENFAELSDEEYFWYPHGLLPQRHFHSEAPEDDTADLVGLVKGVDGLPDATRDDLDDPSYSFYAICWQHRDSMIGFVSRTNPVATLKPGIRYFQYGDAMTTARRPDFALKEGADLVIGADGTAILSTYSFQTLLADVGVSFDHVQKDMDIVRKALVGSINMTSGAEEALLAEASRTRGMARRLRLLPGRLEAISLDAGSLRESLVRHDVDPDLILDENDRFAFDQRHVPVFFDAIESRYFEDDLSSERRRADRYSTRQSPGGQATCESRPAQPLGRVPDKWGPGTRSR
jgi:hypothetical protein